MRKLLITGVVLLLGACGGGGGGSDGGGTSIVSNGICNTVGSGSHVTALATPPSVFTNPTLAFDGNLATYATLGPEASANGTISGGGISGSAGEIAGIAFAVPAGGAVTVTITTYLNGVVTNYGQAGTRDFTTGTDSCSETCSVSGSQAFFGISTNLDFDEIEAAVSVANLDQPLRIEELCLQ